MAYHGDSQISNDWELYQHHNRDRSNRSQMEKFLEFSKMNNGWLPLWKLNHISQTKDRNKFLDNSDVESKVLTNISFLSAFLLDRSQLQSRINKEDVQRHNTDFKIVEPYDISLETFVYQKEGEWYRMSVFPPYESLKDMENDYVNVNGTDFWIDRRTVF